MICDYVNISVTRRAQQQQDPMVERNYQSTEMLDEMLYKCFTYARLRARDVLLKMAMSVRVNYSALSPFFHIESSFCCFENPAISTRVSDLGLRLSSNPMTDRRLSDGRGQSTGVCSAPVSLGDVADPMSRDGARRESASTALEPEDRGRLGTTSWTAEFSIEESLGTLCDTPAPSKAATPSSFISRPVSIVEWSFALVILRMKRFHPDWGSSSSVVAAARDVLLLKFVVANSNCSSSSLGLGSNTGFRGTVLLDCELDIRRNRPLIGRFCDFLSL